MRFALTDSMRTLSLSLSFVLFGLLSACTDAGMYSEEESTKQDNHTDPLVEYPQMAGTYHLSLKADTKVRSIRKGNTWIETVRANQILRIEQTGAQLTATVTTCNASPAEFAGIQPEIDADFLQSIDPVELDATIHLNDKTDEDEQDSFYLESEPITIVYGARLDDPSDPLPTDEDDSRVIDQDRDGEVGITVGVLANTRSVYASAKINIQIFADLNDINEISGVADFFLDTVIYDDNVPFINARKIERKRKADSEIVSKKHSFKMNAVRSDISCSDI